MSPHDPQLFLHVQSLVNRVEEAFPEVNSTLYLQQGQLVWSGVSPHPTKLLVVHVGEDKYHLVVYHAINSTLCLLLQSQPEASIYARLHELIGPLLANLSANLTYIWVKMTTATAGLDMVRFLYFNTANMAVKSTAQGGNVVSSDMVRLAGDLVANLNQLNKEKGKEVTVKTATDQWIVARIAGERSVLVLLMHKNLNLMKVGRLYKTCFDNICMM